MLKSEISRAPADTRRSSERTTGRIGLSSTDWIIAGILTIGGLVCVLLILDGMSHDRYPSRRASCMSNIRNLGLAIQNYASSNNGYLPPAYITDTDGKPMHSWRVLMLPYIERLDLYERYRFDEPWDGPHNRQLHDVIVSVFCCPEEGKPSTQTSYVIVRGNETVWPVSGQITLDDISRTDGQEKTLLLVETTHSGIHWMEPRDLEFSKIPFRVNPLQGKGISSKHKGLAVVAFCDGQVKAIAATTPETTVQALLTVRGGEKIKDYDY